MPRRFFNVAVVAAMVLLGVVLAPLRCAGCKPLFSRRAAGSALAVSFLGLGLAGAAQGVELKCWPRDQLFARLGAQHGETLTHQGVTANGRLVEVLVSPGGTFTAFITLPSGLACPFAAGDGWHEVMPAEPPGERSSLEERWQTGLRG
jgi:hypothetical protein